MKYLKSIITYITGAITTLLAPIFMILFTFILIGLGELILFGIKSIREKSFDSTEALKIAYNYLGYCIIITLAQLLELPLKPIPIMAAVLSFITYRCVVSLSVLLKKNFGFNVLEKFLRNHLDDNN